MEIGGNTIFHKIMRREIPAEIVFEDERAFAFRDISPVAKTHVLIVPKRDIANCNDVTPADAELIGHLVLVAQQIAKIEGIAETGYRLVINCGEDGTQTVPQIHMHLIGGRRLAWPPG